MRVKISRILHNYRPVGHYLHFNLKHHAEIKMVHVLGSLVYICDLAQSISVKNKAVEFNAENQGDLVKILVTALLDQNSAQTPSYS